MSSTPALACIILAAGKGTRMKSSLPKVIHPVAGKPMLYWPISLALAAGSRPVVVVVGHGRREVEAQITENLGQKLPAIRIAVQDPPMGTADAVRVGLASLVDYQGEYVLILIGDAPLLKLATLRAMQEVARKEKPGIVVLTTFMEDPAGYGRIVRSEEEDDIEQVERIVEHKDADADIRDINEINSSIYLMRTDLLRQSLKDVSSANAQGEFYLPDIVQIARAKGLSVLPLVVEDNDEVMGVNDRRQLADAGFVMRMRINEALAEAGVTFLDPTTTFVSPDAELSTDVVLHPGVELRGSCRIGEGTVIESGSIIEDSTLGKGCRVLPYCVIEESIAGDEVEIGPFAHIRPKSELKCESKVGNFVELKKTVLGSGSKANHLSYLGDAVIGEDVNVGAGTITCNYDGVNKYQTIIDDGVFIGSDTQLVAPVRVGKNAVIGAGTTVYQDVPEGALALTRTQQFIKEDYYNHRFLPRLQEAGKLKPKRYNRCGGGAPPAPGAADKEGGE